MSDLLANYVVVPLSVNGIVIKYPDCCLFDRILYRKPAGLKLNRISLLIALVAVIAAIVAAAVFFMADLDSSDTAVPLTNTASESVPVNDSIKSSQTTMSLSNNQHEFVGSEQCASCHQSEHQLWQQSHHRHAFTIADSHSVLADFSSQFKYTDGLAIFELRGERDVENNVENMAVDNAAAHYQIRIQTDQGEQVYPVAYTLGHYPLQQYLLETEPGNLQVFALAWDARPEEQGGQRWMELQAGETASAENAFHWRNYFQNWNSQCADCHTTNFAKGYKPPVFAGGSTDGLLKERGIFNSSWSEAGVTCESCHGPASQHIVWAKGDQQSDNKALLKNFSSVGEWEFKAGQSIASKLDLSKTNSDASSNHTRLETIDSCAACHSLRQPISSMTHEQNNTSWANYFEATRVREPLYFADGQIREEVFVYGSFTQSKMFQAGVTCTNCHNVHSGKVLGFDAENLAQPENDAVCAQCHRADVFAVENHHHHPQNSEAARCVSCHMPERTYMQVDPRRDHSFHKPSPALSELLDTPNACVDCHSKQGASDKKNLDHNNQWAANAIAEWRAEAGLNDAGTVLDYSSWLLRFAKLQVQASETVTAAQQAVKWQSLAVDRYHLLASANTPPMKKAMLLQSMPIENTQAYQALASRLADKSVEVRLAAIERFADFDANVRQQKLMPLLDDPVKAVRLAATLALADLLNIVGQSNGANNQTPLLNKALLKQRIAQFIAAYKSHEELLTSQLKLADLYSRTGDFSMAEQSYQKALVLVPLYVPAMINLADLYRLQARDDKAEKILQRALDAAKNNAEVALQEQADQAVQAPHLSSAYIAALQQQATVEYSLGLLYIRSKNYQQAASALNNAASFAPQNPDYLYAYCLTLDALGQRARAVELLIASPMLANNRQLSALLNSWQ